MSGNPNPIDDVFIDGVSPDKSDVRSFHKIYAALVLSNAGEIGDTDLSQQQIVILQSNGRAYKKDTGDTTSPDDGETLIRDANGIAFSLVVIDGLDGSNGATWISGSGAPTTSPDFGSNGDFYLNETNGDVYKKVAGVWGSPVINIKGDDGTDGADGTDPGILLTWDTGTTDANPGSGKIRANNASLASASILYISKTNRVGNDISTFLAALDDSDNNVNGTLVLTRASDESQAAFIVGEVTDASGYIKLSVSDPSGATSFSALDAISFQFSRAGDKGTDGAGAVDSVNGQIGDVLVEDIIHSASGKTTPIDTDEFALADSATSPSWTLKKVTWANVKATLKTHLDGFYALKGANTDITSLQSSTTVTTQSPGDNSTKIASTAYADAIAALKISNSLLTTRGDIITRGASAPQRLALGAAKTVLRSDGTDALFAQLAMADLSDYSPVTSWTPALSFGGAAVGLTYSSRSGSYVKIGNFIYAIFDIRLSAKGSSTGNAAISGLPVNIATINGQGIITYYSGMATISGAFMLSGSVGGTILDQVNIGGASAVAAATHSNFTNSTIIVGWIGYFV